MNRAQARRTLAQLAGSDADLAFRSGLDVLKAGYADLLLPSARKLAARHPHDPRMHQMHGLAARARGQSAAALAAFARAAELAPADPLIAHSHARTALEAGKPAMTLFDKAARLAPSNGEVILGLSAARLHENSAQDALTFLEGVVGANPLWTDGHRDVAHLRGQLGLDPLSLVERAIAQHPTVEALRLLAVNTAIEALDFERAAQLLQAAEQAGCASPHLSALSAHVASERGDYTTADALFAEFDTRARIEDASLHARHLLRANRPEQAASLLEPLIARDQDHYLWPYLSLAWRLTGDDRWDWLEGDEELVGIYDLAQDIARIDGLTDHLRSLHFASSQPLDQSVRGGTQTDGNLLLRTEPPIAQLRKVIERTVERHIRRLPAYRKGHPTLLKDRAPWTIAGSWSVRLTGAGYHSDHVHSKGWLSSALYLALPSDIGDKEGAQRDGWLSLGECREIVPGLEPVRLVEPRIGRLVLFPSTMWHGTRPFASGERLTVAFDIARPMQEPE